MTETTISPIQKSDRRLYPRQACEIAVSPGNQVIRNISMGGVCLESRSIYKGSESVNLNIVLPQGGPIRFVGSVVRVHEKTDSSLREYGVVFTKVGVKDRRALKNYLLNRFKKEELAELRTRFLSTKRDNVVEISDGLKIRSLMKGVQESHCTLVIFQDGSYEGYLEGRLGGIKEELFTVKTGNASFGENLSFAKPFSIYFDYAFHGYFFESRLDATPKGEMHFRLPKSVFYTDKRNEKRISVTDGQIEFPVPYPRGAYFKARLADLSEGGASFWAPMEGWYFLPGTPLKDVKLKTGSGERIEGSAEVRYLTPTSDNLFKIGIEFSKPARGVLHVDHEKIVPSNKWTGAIKGLYQKLRIGTHLLLTKQKGKTQLREGTPGAVLVARYANNKGREIVSLVNASVAGNGYRIKAPVVIIPPAYGKKKETTAGLALTIVENFRKRGKPIVVIRLDFTNSLGESFKEEFSREEGKNCLNLSPISGMQDILATIDFAENNQRFAPTEIVMVSLSYTSPMARRAILNDRKQRVSYWINVNGTPHMQELIKNASGGIDYVGNVQKGMDPGIINFLGELLDGTKFCRDALAEKMAFIREARDDLSSLRIPVTWIYAKHDSWVNPDAIRDVMSIKSGAMREVIEVATGHMPTSSEEAFGNFRLVTKLIWKHLYGESLDMSDPDMKLVVDTMQRERERLPRKGLTDNRGYWKNYLVGEREKDLGIDVLALTDDYQEMMAAQIDLLKIAPGETILDVGAGTGNFLTCLENQENLSRTLDQNLICLVDFIPEALARASAKLRDSPHIRERAVIQTKTVDLELSRLLPFIRFYRGEYFGLDEMKGRIAGIPDFVIDEWSQRYNAHLHQVLRGKEISDGDLQALEARFSPTGVESALEFNQASQLARMILENKDRTLVEQRLQACHFERLNLGKNWFHLGYPFDSASADKILMSLVLSYIFNPQAVVHELYRILKPGGRLVLSSFRPDADMTISYAKMIAKVERMKESPVPGYSKEELLQAVRDYANAAAALLRYGEEGIFTLFSEEEINGMLQAAGFGEISIMKTFGEPTQVIIGSAVKPPHCDRA